MTPEPDPHNPEVIRKDGKESKGPLLSRRDFIGNTVKLAVAGAVIPGAMSQLLPGVAPDALGGGGVGPVIARDGSTKRAITVGDLNGDPPVVVTAEWNFLPAVVYKVKKSILQASTAKRGYNTGQHAIQHPTEPDHAILVYDGKCKHLGCTVGWDGTLGGSKDTPDYDTDGIPDGRILCPCHQGQYDIYDLAKNVPATPPPEPLNVIRARIEAAELDGQTVPDAIVGFEKLIQGGHRAADLQGDGAPFALFAGEEAA